MLGAANKGDILALKKLTSIGWAILALVFSFVIPGIMLLVADGPIKGLDDRGGTSQTASDEVDKLAKLKSLLDSGAITQQEFDEQKRNYSLNPRIDSFPVSWIGLEGARSVHITEKQARHLDTVKDSNRPETNFWPNNVQTGH